MTKWPRILILFVLGITLFVLAVVGYEYVTPTIIGRNYLQTLYRDLQKVSVVLVISSYNPELVSKVSLSCRRHREFSLRQKQFC
jgi:hypothetical protein